MRPSFGHEHPFGGRPPFGDPRTPFHELRDHLRDARGGVPPFPPFPPGPWPAPPGFDPRAGFPGGPGRGHRRGGARGERFGGRGNDEGSGSRRLYALTDEGRAAAEKIGTPPWEEIARDADPRDVSLRDAIGQLMGATVQVAQAATDDQKRRAVEILNAARRELYGILGESPTDEAEADEDTDEE